MYCFPIPIEYCVDNACLCDMYYMSYGLAQAWVALSKRTHKCTYSNKIPHI